MQLLTFQKKSRSCPSASQTYKWDYLWSPIILKKKSFLVLTPGKFLEAQGSGIGTCLVFCHSFSLSNNVCLHGIKATEFIKRLHSLIHDTKVIWHMQLWRFGVAFKMANTFNCNCFTVTGISYKLFIHKNTKDRY